MRPVIQSRQLDAADADGIATSQTPGGAGNLTLDGVFASGGVATLDVQRQVIITSAGNDSGRTFTITGTDGQGRAITDAVTGANIGAAASVLDFLTVTQIAVDAATAAAVTAGTNGVGASIPIPIDKYLNPTSIGLGVVIVGTVNVTVQHTFGDIFTDNPSTIHEWFDHPTLAAISASADGNLAFPPQAVRLLTNSGIGTAGLSLVQSGAVA